MTKREQPKLKLSLTQRTQLAVGTVGLSLTLLIGGTLYRSPLAKWFGAFAFTGSMSAAITFLYSTGAINEGETRLRHQWQVLNKAKDVNDQRIKRLKREHETALEQLRSRLIQQVESYKEQISPLKAEIEANRKALKQLVTENHKLKTTFDERLEQATDVIKTQVSEDIEVRIEQESNQRSVQKIKERQSVFILRQQELHEIIEDRNTQIEQLTARFEAEFNLAKEEYDKLLEEYSQALSKFNGQVTEAQTEFRAAYSSMNEENKRLYSMLQTYHDPKTFKGSSLADMIGNRIIQFYVSRGINVDAEKAHTTQSHADIWLRTRGTTAAVLKEYDEALQLNLETLNKPKFRVEQGCVVISVQHGQVVKVEAEIERLSPDFIFEIIKHSNHYRISAPTDSGKSSFIDNLIWAMQITHDGQMRLTLFDPKYPFTEWNGHSPDYQGFDQCLSGFETLTNKIQERLDQAKTSFRAGNGIPEFPPHFFAIDEMEALMDEARLQDTEQQQLPKAERDEFTKRIPLLARRGLKMGRGLTKVKGKGIIVAYITQSPLCSRIGLNKDDFYNSTNIFLGGSIDYAFETELPGRFPAKQLTKMRQQVELRREKGEKYFALVQFDQDLHVWDLPKPNHFAAVYESNHIQPPLHHEGATVDDADSRVAVAAKPTVAEAKKACPHCKSTQLKSHGYTGKKDSPNRKARYKCQSCSRTTSSPVNLSV